MPHPRPDAWIRGRIAARLGAGLAAAPSALRLTAVTNVYRASRELFLARRFARHVSPLTTTVYTHPSDQEMSSRLRRLSC